MNIQVIAEHSVALDLLPKKANILDLGARGCQFCNHFKSLGHNVFSVDCDNIEGITHPNLAISNFSGHASIIRDVDPQATRVVPYNGKYKNPFITLVNCMTLQEFSKSVGIEVFDLIKIDIEAAEYEVIMSLDYPPAVQISWEAHLHTGLYKIAQVREMEEKLSSLGYIPLRHEMTKQHGLCENYWDSLWVIDAAKSIYEEIENKWPRCEFCGEDLVMRLDDGKDGFGFACRNENCKK